MLSEGTLAAVLPVVVVGVAALPLLLLVLLLLALLLTVPLLLLMALQLLLVLPGTTAASDTGNLTQLPPRSPPLPPPFS